LLMLAQKPKLSFWQIINMNVGFFGIQYSFGLQQSAVNPIYDFLGAKPDEIPWLNLAGPLTGLIIQPIIGALSDKTWDPKFGRRKPYFLIGAIMCSLALFVFPFSSNLWMAAGLLWILDVGNNTAMEPYRAFVADKLDTTQQATGFQAQSFFTGFGQTLANLSLLAFPLVIAGKTGKIPNWVFASFIFGSVCSIVSIWWSMRTTPEIVPSNNEIAEIEAYNQGKPNKLIQFFGYILAISVVPLAIYFLLKQVMPTDVLNLLLLPLFFGWVFLLDYILNKYKHVAFINALHLLVTPLVEVIAAIKTMPKTMWILALVYLFQWYALFCYWQNSSKAVAQNVYNWHSINMSAGLEKEVNTYSLFEKNLRTYAEDNKLDAKTIFTKTATPTELVAKYGNKINTNLVLTDSVNIISANNKVYEKAVSDTGGINGWYNIVTFLVAFLLVGFAQRFGAKWVHIACLILAGVGFIIFSQGHSLPILYAAITGFGVGWASMMGIPYLLVVGDIPKEKYGVYMGIINMMIVIPMFIQTITFGSIMKNVLQNDSSKAILFAGILLLIAAVCTLLIQPKKVTDFTDVNRAAAH
jgi:maltose/moltooligosaccharide transporter